MDEGFDDMFLKKYIQTANKHGKRCSISLVTKEVHTKSREPLRTHTEEDGALTEADRRLAGAGVEMPGTARGHRASFRGDGSFLDPDRADGYSTETAR